MDDIYKRQAVSISSSPTAKKPPKLRLAFQLHILVLSSYQTQSPAMASTDDGNPSISTPRPLMKHSKSMATGLRNSTMPSGSRPDSVASATSQSSSSGMSMIQVILKTLNTPITDAGMPPKTRSSMSDRSSVFSRLRRSEDKQVVGGDQPPPVSRLRPTSNLRETTMSLLSDYSAFRSSIMSSPGTGMPSEEIVAAAKNYYSSMKVYLILVDDLPSSVRDTLEVKRLRQQLEFTVELLQPVMHDSQSEQTILLLDNTLMLVKTILSDVQYLLLQQTNPPAPVPEEDEREDDTSSTEAEYEYDIPDAHLAILVDGPAEDNAKPELKGIRRMRSSMALLGAFSKKEPSGDSGNAATEDTDIPSHPDPDSDDQRVHRPILTQHPGQTQETLVDFSQNIEAVADSLIAFKAFPLFAEANRSEVIVGKPADTVNITYGQDGTPVAMSPAAIIEQLVKELGSQPARIEMPSGDFSDIIFTTFRFFWTPMEFLEHLEGAYDDSYYNDRKLSIILIARNWVLAYWVPQDSEAKGVIKGMQRFLGKALTDGLVCGSIIIDILLRLEEYAVDPTRSAITREVPELQYESMPWRFIDISRDMPLYRRMYKNIRIMEFNNKVSCLEFARQLTLKESALYLQLTAREVISCFVNENKEQEVIAREKMRQQREFSYTIKRWAAYNVLRRSTPLKRAKMFAFMMRLAKACLGIRNFSSAHSIYNGLLSIHLDILDQTEAELTPKPRRNLIYVANFFDENKDISMQSSAQPTVPIMATYAGKLSRLLEAKGIKTKSKVDDSVELVNISFFKAATRITYAMESNQHPYEFKAHAPLQGFIDHTLVLVPGEDEIHDLYLNVKGEEQSNVQPAAKPGILYRLRSNSTAAFPMF